MTEEEEDADELPAPQPKQLQVQIPETNHWILTPVTEVVWQRQQQQQQPIAYSQLSEHSNEPSPARPSTARISICFQSMSTKQTLTV